MAKDLNKMQATGRLGRDPEMRYTPQGSAVTTFSVASERQWKDASGEKKEETEWLNCVAWNKLGEVCNQYLSKGDRVYIEGRLQTRSWEDQETGQKRYKTEIILSDMIMLSSRRDAPSDNGEEIENGFEEPAPQAPARQPAPAAAPARSAARPNTSPGAAAARSNGTRAPARNVPQAIENDEDLPF